jgi:hypothetical protein
LFDALACVYVRGRRSPPDFWRVMAAAVSATLTRALLPLEKITRSELKIQ